MLTFPADSSRIQQALAGTRRISRSAVQGAQFA